MIYLDYNASTPLDPRVFAAMTPFFSEEWANPSSPYEFAKKPATAIEKARNHVAYLIGAQPEEIIFTSGATESNQTILQSVLPTNAQQTIVTTSVEHKSVLEALKEVKKVHKLSIDNSGLIDLEELEDICGSEQVTLVSIIWANNETGVISDIQSIAKLCDKYNIPFHTDAVQASGKLKIDVQETPIDYLSLSSYKIFGPKGVGATYVRTGSPYKPMIAGSQEQARRGGTEAVPLIVGFGKAAELAANDLPERIKHTKQVRDLLEQSIQQQIPDTYINGNRERRLTNTTNIGFRGIDSDVLIQLLSREGIMVSNGSACTSSALTPSHVLLAMGKSHDEANEAIRFSLSHITREDEVIRTVETLKDIVTSIRR
ncbi:MAG: cysteine desulfurase [Verrucomicrobiae bacterium]|nr:cysteine desulfurase [Verrucomicrobiae bacterium]